MSRRNRAAVGLDKRRLPRFKALTMTLRSILLLTLSLVLAGCATAEQTAARNNERCVNRGYQPGTPDFNKCLQAVDNERVQRLDARRQEWSEKSGSPFAR